MAVFMLTLVSKWRVVSENINDQRFTRNKASARPVDRDLGGDKFTKELATESVTMSGEFDGIELEGCCEMIESHVFGQKRSFKRADLPGRRPVWISNDDHQIQFNELLQMWQVVNSTTINPVGEAFSHGRNAADECPTETEWTVRNLDSWLSVKNFARCQVWVLF